MAIAYNTSVVRSGLVLHLDAANRKSYPGTGTVWNDLSGASNNGTLVNGVAYSAANNGSMVFDGGNDSVSFSQRIITTEFQYNNAFTVSSFCQIKENSGEGYIINNRFTDTNGTLYAGWGLMNSNGQIWGFVGGFPSGFGWRRVQTSSSAFTSLVYNKWCHITYVNTGIAGEQKIYLNSVNNTNIVIDDTNPPYTINYSNGNSRIYVGVDGTYPHNLTGDISQISVYNRALTVTEISQNFNALRGRYGI